MASSAAVLAATVGAYASRCRALDGLQRMHEGVSRLNAIAPGVVPPELDALMSQLQYFDPRRASQRWVTCAYCGRRRSELLATSSCKGCGAQETTQETVR